MKLDVVQNQIQGDRDYQQDNLGERDIGDFKLLILADGMGGYYGGEIASKIVVDTFMRYPFINENTFLEEALDSANNKILEYKELNVDVSNMGTTLIAVLIGKKSYKWVSVGDSPLYVIHDNTLTRVNENHSVAGMLDLQISRGEISKKEAAVNKNRHKLTSALLGEEISMIDISKSYTFKAKDKLVLASDGIETLCEDDILNIINTSVNMRLAMESILNEIKNKKKKNQDNATLIIASPILEEVEDNQEKDIQKGQKRKNLIKNIGLFVLILAIFVLIWK